MLDRKKGEKNQENVNHVMREQRHALLKSNADAGPADHMESPQES
jgi:hypothetical protein